MRKGFSLLIGSLLLPLFAFAEEPSVWQHPTFEKTILAVGNRLVEKNSIDPNKYLFQIEYNSNQANASFTYQQNIISITDKMLNLIDNDDQLAFLLGHEIAHEQFAHGSKTELNVYNVNKQIEKSIEQAAQEKIQAYKKERDRAASLSTGATVVGLIAAIQGYNSQSLYQNANNLALRAQAIYEQKISELFGQVVSLNATAKQQYRHSVEYTTFKRAQEKEADMRGIQLMCQAGYDPHQALIILRKFSNNASDSILDHPNYEERENVIMATINSDACPPPPTSVTPAAPVKTVVINKEVTGRIKK